jgi:hypothetical protein
MNPLNLVTWKDIAHELSDAAKSEIHRLTWWLQDPEANALTWRRRMPIWAEKLENQLGEHLRFAPSLLIRSELEVVLGGSSPRFALRYALPDKFGFINLRRLNQLETVLRSLYPDGGYFPFAADNMELSIEFSSWEKAHIDDLKLHRESSVAECFIPTPERYPKRDFHVITAPLAALFGETDPPDIFGRGNQ